MADCRIDKYADVLVNFSTAVKPGENILIEAHDAPVEMTKALVKKANEAGANVFVSEYRQPVFREMLMGANEEQLKAWAKYNSDRMKDMQCYIGLRASDNTSELSDVPHDKLSMFQTLYSKPVHGEIRVPKTRWVVCRFPNGAMAQSAGMSTEAFEKFFYDVCTLDYGKMDRAMDALGERMKRADKVHITGVGTDLTFSIKGIPPVKCAGHMNIPDGEIYTAPVKDSANGYITYNTASEYQSFKFTDIRLEFKDGKIVKATSNDDERINKVFDTDEGARYIGEFSFGINPYILEPMLDTLFDEKIAGSIHLTPGSSYDDAFNGNKSAVHWDLVYIQRPEYGGGEIWFDDELIRKDGRFVPEYLQCLNPENLI